MKRQVEIPVNDNYITTSRSLDFNHPDNVNLLARKNDLKYKELLNEVKIRFDTNPKYYQKEDYWKLILLIDQHEGLTPDDFKTINGQSLIGKGDIKITDCEIDVEYTFGLNNNKYIYVDGIYQNNTINLTNATYDVLSKTIIL